MAAATRAHVEPRPAPPLRKVAATRHARVALAAAAASRALAEPRLVRGRRVATILLARVARDAGAVTLVHAEPRQRPLVRVLAKRAEPVSAPQVNAVVVIAPPAVHAHARVGATASRRAFQEPNATAKVEVPAHVPRAPVRAAPAPRAASANVLLVHAHAQSLKVWLSTTERCCWR